MSFYQEPPEISNFYTSNQLLATYLELHLPNFSFEDIDKDLQRFGDRVVDEIDLLGKQAIDREPVLENFDGWGRRVDEITVSQAWDDLKAVAAEEGLIAIGYDRLYGRYSRLYQMAKLILYTPSSAIYTCPLAMADGAARLIETMVPEQLSETFDHLTSRDPDSFWVAGQWMTEREGGSDVGNTSTVARHVEGDTYLLSGDKWFTSAATAEIAMTLARIETDGETTPGSRGLSLFYLQIRDENGDLNGIQINKLKDKLGTRSLPTAELTLENCRATLIGEPGRGVKYISTILNITRIYNAISSISYMGRALDLATDYAGKREAFGRYLKDLPLHQQVLADLEIEYTTSSLLVYYVTELLGKVETGKATNKEDAILRLLTPVAKLWTGKRAISMVSEMVESIGGMGYIEESGIPVLLRDAQVFSIWEGTTNVLSLDVLRAIRKEKGLRPLLEQISGFLDSSHDLNTHPLISAVADLQAYAADLATIPREEVEAGARQFSFSMARITISYLLLKFYKDLQDKKSNHPLLGKIGAIYRVWIRQDLVTLRHFTDEFLDDISAII